MGWTLYVRRHSYPSLHGTHSMERRTARRGGCALCSINSLRRKRGNGAGGAGRRLEMQRARAGIEVEKKGDGGGRLGFGEGRDAGGEGWEDFGTTCLLCCASRSRMRDRGKKEVGESHWRIEDPDRISLPCCVSRLTTEVV